MFYLCFLYAASSAPLFFSPLLFTFIFWCTALHFNYLLFMCLSVFQKHMCTYPVTFISMKVCLLFHWPVFRTFSQLVYKVMNLFMWTYCISFLVINAITTKLTVSKKSIFFKIHYLQNSKSHGRWKIHENLGYVLTGFCLTFVGWGLIWVLRCCFYKRLASIVYITSLIVL